MKISNKKPVLIIISGAPASGKTTLSKLIARKFNLAVLNKDELKEIMADSIGCDSERQSLKYGIASFRLIDYFVDVMMKTNMSFVVEANFDGKYSLDFFKDIESKGDYQLFQLFCDAPVEQLYDRFIERDNSGDRHACHKARIRSFDRYKKDYNDRTYRLDIVNTIDIDTSDFERIDYDLILYKIKEYVNYLK